MKKTVLLFFLFSGLLINIHGQNEKFKALFMYNFTKYIEWPVEYRSGDFIIAVLGSTPMITELELIAERRKVETQTMVIQQYNSIGDIRKCHILYIPSGKSSSLSEVLNKLSTQPTLIITDAPGLARKGSSINYVLKGTKKDFEINKKQIETSHLKINTTLLSLGTVVE